MMIVVIVLGLYFVGFLSILIALSVHEMAHYDELDFLNFCCYLLLSLIWPFILVFGVLYGFVVLINLCVKRAR